MKSAASNSSIGACIATRLIVTIFAILAPPGVHANAADPPKGPYDYLAGSIADKDRSLAALRALKAIEDKELAPLFVAMSRSGDKTKRLMAVGALGRIGGDHAVAALKQRLSEDTMMAIRAEAIVHLLNLKAADAPLLAGAAKVGDDSIRCIAARSLSTRSSTKKHKDLALATLKELVESNEPITAVLARVRLLAMGDGTQLPFLTRLIANRETDVTIVRLTMIQIYDEKIASAAPLARTVIGSADRPLHVRVLACRALAAASPKATPVIFESLRKSSSMIYRISALAIIAERKDAGPYLAAIAKSSLAVGTIARFEQARKTPGPAASLAIQKALELKHPIVINHVLQQAEQDIEKLKDKADFYTPGLLKYIASVDADTPRMGPQHVLAARATTMLLDLGTPTAMAGVRKILAGRYSAVTRSAAAGLLRTKNKAVCPIARDLLKSPYPELASDAALTLGHFADPAAAEYFNRIITRESGHSITFTTMASWYLLKIQKQSAAAAKKLAALIK